MDTRVSLIDVNSVREGAQLLDRLETDITYAGMGIRSHIYLMVAAEQLD